MLSTNGRLILAAILLGSISLALPGSAAESTPAPAAACDDGCTVVEEICYKDVVVRSHCRLVPDTKTVKKTVYSYKTVAFCKPGCPNLLRRCGDAEACTECECCPRYKRVLVKREIVEKKEGFKCVVEEEKERVPYTVYRRVPCAQAPAAPAASEVRCIQSAGFANHPAKSGRPAIQRRVFGTSSPTSVEQAQSCSHVARSMGMPSRNRS
jgi:hypothetical protein